jgi:hypothetical protein
VAVAGGLLSLFAVIVAVLLPPAPDLAVYDVLEKHGFLSVAARDNIQYGFVTGEHVFEQEDVSDSESATMMRDFDRLFSTSATTNYNGEQVYAGFGGFEPIEEVRILDSLYDRGERKNQRIMLVVVRWEGRRLNLWERFKRWAGL